MAFDPVTAIADFAGKVVDKIFPDKTEAAKAKAALDLTALQQDFQLVLGQIQVNAEEAKSASVFVAGARPFILWVCGFAFAWQYVAGPFLMFALNALGYPASLPVLEYGELSTLLFGMLGLGGMRSYDKSKKNGPWKAQSADRLVLVILTIWCASLTIGFGLALHELIQTKEQAVVAQGVSMRANEQTDKWAREYNFHVKLYHENKEK